jgi:hypothetical protein
MRRSALAILVLVLSSSAAFAAPATPRLRRYLVVAGVDDGGGGRARLRYARADARSLAQVLFQLGGADRADAVIMDEPSPAALLAGLRQAAARVKEGAAEGVQRQLLFYYSGHSDEEGLLLGGQRLGYLELRKAIDAVPAEVRVAILDSCASGAFTRLKGGTYAAPFMLDTSSRMTGHAYLTSSSATESAQESDRIGASFFTHYLVSGLRGAADVNGDRKVSLNEAFKFASDETLARTERTRGGPQHASYDFNLAGTGELTITDVSQTTSGLVLGPEVSGRVSVRQANGTLVAELNKLSGRSVELGLEPGEYVVVMDGREMIYEAPVALKNGQRADVARLNFHTVKRVEVALRGNGPVEEPSGVTTIPQASQLRAQVHPTAVPYNPGQRNPSVDGLAIGVIGNRAYSVSGLQLSFAVNFVDTTMRGIQMSLAYNSAGSLNGAQFAVGANWVFNDGEGWQSAVGANWVRGHFHGAQTAVGFNWAGSVRGAQIGLINASKEVDGTQIGLVNVAPTVRGAAIGLVNVAMGLKGEGEMRGAQIGLLNVGRHASGLQLGLVNLADEHKGFSLGLLNVARTQEGESLALLSLIGDGVHSGAVFATDVGLLNVAVKLGGRHLYTLMQAGFQPGDTAPAERADIVQRGDRRYSFGGGVGWRAPLTERFSLDTELTGVNVVRRLAEIGDDRPTDTLFSLRAIAAYRLQPHLSVIAGLTYNMAMTFKARDLDIGTGVLERQEKHGDANFRYYPGIILGVQI